MRPVVSIITVCYNSECFIKKTISSVSCQKYPYIEYIIIDGGSEDSTAQIVDTFGNKVSKFISEPDNGIYDAMNKGIDLSTGEWVLFLNSGDTLHNPLVISDFVNYLNSSKEETVYLGLIQTTISGSKGKVVKPKTEISPWYTPPHQGTFFPLRLLKENKFNLSFNILGDRELYIRLMKTKNLTPTILPIIVANYDLGGISSDGTKSLKIFSEAKKIKKLYGGSGLIKAYCRAITKYLLSKIISSETLVRLRYS
ncbi:MAG TPA: glycosyltransferase [Porphyromonadaceae bacterium]|nr:glycosyltransferase family 2 protein [Prevotella sp.]HAB41640.1 glycosyltransferase [Porphyromonadaceae bacterium]